jgi:hypothetical protein
MDAPLEARHHGERGREREQVRVVRQDQVLEVRQARHLHGYLSVLGVLARRRAAVLKPSPDADVGGVGPVRVQMCVCVWGGEG